MSKEQHHMANLKQSAIQTLNLLTALLQMLQITKKRRRKWYIEICKNIKQKIYKNMRYYSQNSIRKIIRE